MKNIFLNCLFIIAACDKGVVGGTVKPLPPTTAAAPTVSAATGAQCPAGGYDITLTVADGSQRLLTVCNGQNGQNGQDGIRGPQGNPGQNGANGIAGTSSTIETLAATVDQCPAGGTVFLVETTTPEDACETECTTIQSAVVCNGQQGERGDPGQDGASGLTPFTTVGFIEPCGAQSSSFKEELICLADGSLLASFSKTSGGADTRLAFLVPGTYEDTDGSKCVFTVAADDSGGLRVTWDAQGDFQAGGADCAPQVSQ